MTANELKQVFVENIDELVTDTAKDQLVNVLKDVLLPQIKDVAAAYTSKLKESAADEAGWTKFRDSAFIPLVINIMLVITEKMLAKMTERTTK